MSGGEPSSIKRIWRCAAGMPVLSACRGKRRLRLFEFGVYGLILYLVFCMRGDRLYQALYRKYRPAVFDDVCGQEHITDVLRQEIKTGSISHAYLFCGSRGTGKTTCAKIFAKAVNCLNPCGGNPCGVCEVCRGIDTGKILDVIEMDAASNTGVDYIREIKEDAAYSPASANYRVYILDEVHMLTEQAFNALLKTLEEPPKNVIFILATTELQKIPATVLSRCLRFDFRRIPSETIARRLEYIASCEGFSVDTEAALLIAVLAGGGLRDAIGILELCVGKGEAISAQTVRDVVGITSRQDVEKILTAVVDRDFSTIFGMIDGLYHSSKDISVFVQDVLSCCRDMLIIKSCGKNADRDLFDLTAEEYSQTCLIADRIASEKLLYFVQILEDVFLSINRMKSGKRLLVEIAFVQMATPSLSDTPKALLARISDLEAGIAVRKQEPFPEPVIEQGKMKPSAPEEHQEKEKRNSAFSEKAAAYWSDVVSKYANIDMGTATFLQRAKAYKGSDGVLRLYVTDSFSEMMLKKEDVLANLKVLLASFDDALKDVCVQVRAMSNEQDHTYDGVDLFLKENTEDLI